MQSSIFRYKYFFQKQYLPMHPIFINFYHWSMIIKWSNKSKPDFASYIPRQLLLSRKGWVEGVFSTTVSLQLPTMSDVLELHFLLNRDQPKNNKKSHIKTSSTNSKRHVNEQKNSSLNCSFNRKRPNDCYIFKGIIINHTIIIYLLNREIKSPSPLPYKLGLKQKSKSTYLQIPWSSKV